MPIEAYCSKIVFNDGTSIDAKPGDIILIVGANNSGKSLSLRNISDLASGMISGPQSVAEIEITRCFDTDQLYDFLSEFYPTFSQYGSQVYTLPDGHQIQKIVVDTVLSKNKTTKTLGPLAKLFFKLLDGATRLSMANATGTIDFETQHKTHPLHFLYDNDSLLDKLSRWFQKAFGVEIAINFRAGSVIPLHVGKGASLREGENPHSPEYRERLKSIPRLDTQGDGMKSFAGLLLYTLLMDQSIYLVDEPEAFLHPPQAKLLGRLLAEQLEQRQLIVATHSADFVRGVLESNRANVKIVRLRRDSSNNIARILTAKQINEIWSDPALRYSNILDGIFHEKVIVCEADGDCRFYAAIADALRKDEAHPYVRDLMFTQSGGKGGMPKLIAALRCLDVPIAAVVDFDVIQQTGQLNAIINALGGKPDNYAADIKLIKDAINELGGKTVSATKTKIKEIVDSVPDSEETFPPSISNEIRKHIKASPGWHRAKTVGLGILSPGIQKIAGERLVSDLAKIGLYVVPSGELESFETSILSRKNEWLAEVLRKHAGQFGVAIELREANEFVRQFISRA